MIGVAIGRRVFSENTDILLYCVLSLGSFVIAIPLSIVGPQSRRWLAPLYLLLGGASLVVFELLSRRFEGAISLALLIPLGGAFLIGGVLSAGRLLGGRLNKEWQEGD